MKIFNNQNLMPQTSFQKKEESLPIEAKEAKNEKFKGLKRLNRPRKSDHEIRNRIAQLKGETASKVSLSLKNHKKIDGPKEPAFITGDTGVETPNNVLSSNDPRDTSTTEKLKEALNSGVINFNGKEKEVLSKILKAK